jgi:uncharacterized protein with GYD domain
MGDLKLSIFAVNSKHTPQSCPMFNYEVKQRFKEVVGKREEVAKKHGIKIISAYTSILDHLIFHIVEAPSQQALENYFIETGFAFWNNIEIREAKLVEDVIKKVVG